MLKPMIALTLLVLTDTHFSFTTMQNDNFWAAGTGTYTFKQGQYTETLRLNSFGEQPGTQFKFQSRVEGAHGYNERFEDGQRVEYQVWQQVD